MPTFEYERVPGADNVQPAVDRKPAACSVSLLAVLATLITTAIVASSIVNVGGGMLRSNGSDEDLTRDIILISDPHVDPLFNPLVSMQGKVCHSCDLSTSVYGANATCPTDLGFSNQTNENVLRGLGYAFGRYGCNPPHLLWKSLLQNIRSIDSSPKIVVFTGDLAPHGYPGDLLPIGSDMDLRHMCEAKFLITKQLVKELVKTFPHTRWAFTLGNNDYFPKDRYWQDYIKKMSDMMHDEGFLTAEQHQQNATGSIALDRVSYPGNSAEQLFALRKQVLYWANDTLRDAKNKHIPVWLVGHQPLRTKEGADEYDVSSSQFRELKNLLSEYKDIIKVGLFGHINQAGLSEVLSDHYLPLFPAITAPGISPRGLNHPSFLVFQQSVRGGNVVDFEQHVFDLMDENQKAQQYGHSKNDPYLGSWKLHNGELRSWRTLTGNLPFTTESLLSFLERAKSEENVFFALEIWRRAGYIGDETPEYLECKLKFDRIEEMMRCLFPEQDPACWKPNKWMT